MDPLTGLLSSGGGSLAFDMGSDAGSGDSSSGGNFAIDGMNFGAKSNNNMLLIGLAVLATIIYLKK